MKVRFLLVAVVLFFAVVFSSCHRHHHDVSVSIQESEEEYRLSASFDESKTRQVQNYIDEYTGNNGIFRSGGNVEIDATTTLEDNIRVYIKSHPGRLKIKFDKADNDEAAYEKVKDMCEGIKALLAKN
jgi:hypothetical protein